ncbi:MAG: hypothetical protein ACXAC7_01155 [Candidatus Hodarchaeales archaeon]
MDTINEERSDHFINNFIESFGTIIEKTIKSKSNLKYTGPSPRQRKNHRTISFNIYPKKEYFDEFWNDLIILLKDFFNKWNKQGEILFFESSKGLINDSGSLAFYIEQAYHWECYFYPSESSCFCRLLREKDIQDKNKWISIDLDFIEKSAWFV